MNKSLEIIKENQYLKKFIDDNNLTDDYLLNHYGIFLRVLKSRDKCQNCKGLYMCNQQSVGGRLDVKYDGVLIDEVEYCDYALTELKKDNLYKKYVYCDVADNYLDISLENINFTANQKQLYLLLAAILHKKTDQGLYIYGDLGVGKTYLCIALANSLVKNNEKVAFVKISSFFNEIRSLINIDSSQIDILINKLMKSTYLFFDDIGSEAVSEFVRDDILFRILDYRMENKLITIFTSNLSKDDLLKHYQFDRKEKSNLMNAKRLLERIDILAKDYVLVGENLRRRL